jgi:hypothetical protein
LREPVNAARVTSMKMAVNARAGLGRVLRRDVRRYRQRVRGRKRLLEREEALGRPGEAVASASEGAGRIVVGAGDGPVRSPPPLEEQLRLAAAITTRTLGQVG